METNQLIVSSSPHIRSSEDVAQIMKDVLIALLPATLASIYFFRMGAIVNILVGVLGAVGAEFLCQKVMKRKVTINDFSAAVTGLLLAMNVPASLPWWITLVGSAFAIIMAKQVFGGLGHNFMNPALVARAALLAAYPSQMTGWVNTALNTSANVDGLSAATPLAVIKGGEAVQAASLFDMFVGNVPGTLGETSAILLILGGCYLIYRKVISPRIPLVYIGTVALLTFVFSGFDPMMIPYNLFGGGLMLGAFFMATDYSSSPVNEKAQLVYAFGCGLLTSIIRYYGGYPEGVSYSILLMNVAAPLMDKMMKPRVFGEVSKNVK
ncbi:MAG: RnfABCDGE type electron transport complex subunit D [Filifactor alocis]|nr:RnfABCDGE type electron transport complex subunit D [Filifactor alocis]